MSSDLGERIRFFRKRSGLSQLELEMQSDSASGSISRMETSVINPTKESLKKIAEVLKLNAREISYLIGVTAEPATEKEINDVKNEVADYFSKPGVLAYVLDDRWRLIVGSDSMKRLLKLSNQDLQKIYNTSIVKDMLDQTYPLYSFINNSKLEEMLYFQLSRFYLELDYLENDSYYKQALDAIKTNSISNKIWQNILVSGAEKILPRSSREVTFSLGPINAQMQYSREVIQKYPRFEIIEYFPTNVVLKLLSKML